MHFSASFYFLQMTLCSVLSSSSVSHPNPPLLKAKSTEAETAMAFKDDPGPGHILVIVPVFPAYVRGSYASLAVSTKSKYGPSCHTDDGS